jgi:hypothetical protein
MQRESLPGHLIAVLSGIGTMYGDEVFSWLYRLLGIER